MYKLVLVDDEEEVRQGILNKIDWRLLGYEILGEAENGRDALEIIEKTIPDVLITDIIMPFMDGLELSEIIRKKFPTIKIIILTGFDEFEYAQKAVKLHVTEYVLKPVAPGELTDLLVRVKSDLDEEIARKKNIQVLKEHYEKSMPVLREKLLTSLITKKLKKDEISEKAESYKLDIDGGIFVVSVVSIDPKTAKEQENDLELLRYAVLKISDEIVQSRGKGLLFLHEGNCVIIFAYSGCGREAAIESVLGITEEIRQSICKYLDMTVTAGIGTAVTDITDACDSYRNAESALDYRLVLGGNRIIFTGDMELQCSRSAIIDEHKERSLVRSIKFDDKKELENIINSLFEEIGNSRASFREYQILLMELLSSVLRLAAGMNTDLDKILGDSFNLFLKMSGFGSIEEAKNWVLELCTRIMEHISVERQDTCKYLVQKAKDYIGDNFHSSSISIDSICKYLHISPAYFSSIFKKETGTTFVTYLVQMRMEAAKELLKMTNLKSFEIAEKTGFSEPNYFSYCFKKNYGISPTEYRNGLQ